MPWLSVILVFVSRMDMTILWKPWLGLEIHMEKFHRFNTDLRNFHSEEWEAENSHNRRWIGHRIHVHSASKKTRHVHIPLLFTSSGEEHVLATWWHTGARLVTEHFRVVCFQQLFLLWSRGIYTECILETFLFSIKKTIFTKNGISLRVVFHPKTVTRWLVTWKTSEI